MNRYRSFYWKFSYIRVDIKTVLRPSVLIVLHEQSAVHIMFLFTKHCTIGRAVILFPGLSDVAALQDQQML